MDFADDGEAVLVAALEAIQDTGQDCSAGV